MDFRRSGQLDERRRRVLMDEIATPADAENASPASTAKGPIRAYPPATLAEHQPRVTDLLPVRPLWAVVAILLALTGIAIVEAVHTHVAPLVLREGQAHLAALDARERGSIATWYGATLLALAAISAALTFGIRVHRVDDYRGRYRVWLWTGAALAWLSLDCATGVHDALALGLNVVAGRQLLTGTLQHACTITWLAVYGLAFGTLGLRLAVEVWPSRLSFTSLLAAGGFYMAAALFEMDVVRAPGWMIPGVIESSVLLVAHWLLLSSVGLYCRHVYLDATGRLKVRIDAERKPKSKTRARLKIVKDEKQDTKPRPSVATAPTSAEPAKFGSAASSTAAASKAGASIAKQSVSVPDADDEDDDASYGENLSKSERRRLKKIARREQRRAA